MSDPLTQIAEDIYEVQLPLPFALRIVNCYLIQGDDGWIIVDTGLNIPQAQKIWRGVFDSLGIDLRDIGRLVLTHMHPDHYGMTGWFQELCGENGNVPPVVMSPREVELAQAVWRTREHDVRSAVFDLLKMCGTPESMLARISSEVGSTRAGVFPLPHLVETLDAGSVLDTGRRRFQAIHAPGHSDGQLLFYDADDRLLLCGDHVLMEIMPNIGLWPATEPDPLGRYLDSLRELKALDVRLALPAHRQHITDWRGRLAELEKHHADRLALMLAAVDGGATVYEVGGEAFDIPALSVHEVRFALTETLAHLEYMRGVGQVRREGDGVWRYHAV